MAKTTDRNPQCPIPKSRSAGLRISDEMPEIESRRAEPAEALDYIDELWPDMPPDARRIVSQLETRADDIEKWFVEDPRRIRGLFRNPRETIEQLARDFELDGARYAEVDAANVTLTVNYPSKPPLGTSLLRAVWDHVALNAEGFTSFRADPDEFIHNIADTTGASGAETEAVVQAVRLVLKGAVTDRDPDFLAGIWAHAAKRPEPGFKLRVRKNGV